MRLEEGDRRVVERREFERVEGRVEGRVEESVVCGDEMKFLEHLQSKADQTFLAVADEVKEYFKKLFS